MIQHSNFSIGAKYLSALEIREQGAADAYFAHCVTQCMDLFDIPQAEAEVIERKNLAYIAGYYFPDTQRRIAFLFHCLPHVPTHSCLCLGTWYIPRIQRTD